MTPDEQAAMALKHLDQFHRLKGSLGDPPELIGELHPERTSDNGDNGAAQ